MVHLIETTDGIVNQVITFLNTPGISGYDAACNLAKLLCETNGIEFEGKISCDNSPQEYSVQIFEVE